MSVRETDRNIDKYIGIGFPLGFSNTGLFHQTKNVLEQASYNLRNLLLTSKGERVGQPDFGCELTDIIFEQEYTNELGESHTVNIPIGIRFFWPES